MSHPYPLLTQVLAEALIESGIFDDPTPAIAAIPTDIADRLEAALDVCQWQDAMTVCGQLKDSEDHFHKDGYGHEPNIACHPYVPLVQRIDQEGGR